MRQFLFIAVCCAACLSYRAHAILPGTTTSAWPWVGRIGGATANASAVAVQDHWVLTAKHVASGYGPNDMRFRLDDGSVYESNAIFLHPTDDIALVRVSSMPGWYDLYLNTNDIGQIGTMVGYGVSGTWNGSSWTYQSYPADFGTKREGRNRLSFSQYVDFGSLRGTFTICDFDSATNDIFGDGVATTNECTLGGGDSGGPTLLQQSGVWKVVGIHSWVGSVSGGPSPPQYGSVFGDLRVPAYKTWLESIIPAEVTVATMTPGPGMILSGSLAELTRPDDSRVVMRPGAVSIATAAPVQLVVTGISPVATTTELRFCVESQASLANIGQTIELFNWVSDSYELVETRTLSISDTLSEIVVTNSPSNYIGTGSEVRARIRCKATGAVAVFPWQARFDRIVWNIKR